MHSRLVFGDKAISKSSTFPATLVLRSLKVKPFAKSRKPDQTYQAKYGAFIPNLQPDAICRCEVGATSKLARLQPAKIHHHKAKQQLRIPGLEFYHLQAVLNHKPLYLAAYYFKACLKVALFSTKLVRYNVRPLIP